jgi:hypothetical protein
MLTFSLTMFTSVLCWAETWRKEHCPEFDMGRILPCRFIMEQDEYHRFLAQMDGFLDCYPCGLHTSLLDPIWLCKVVFAWRRPNAKWPSLVACSVLEFGGYGELVAGSEDELIGTVVDFLTNPGRISAFEERMQADREAEKGVYSKLRLVDNFRKAIPRVVKDVERAGGVRKRLEDIDLCADQMHPLTGVDGPLVPREMRHTQCDRVFDELVKTRYSFGDRGAEARKVLLFAVDCGLELISRAGSGARVHAVRAVHTRSGNPDVPQGSRVILKLLHGGRDKGKGNKWCKTSALHTDQNITSVDWMETAFTALGQDPELLGYVIRSLPVFSTARGLCSAGYLAFKDNSKLAMSFHCCEDMTDNLCHDTHYKKIVDEFRIHGIISCDRDRFERGLFKMLAAFHSKGLYVLDVSLGNLAVRNGLPCVIDVGNGQVLERFLDAKSVNSTIEMEQIMADGNGFVLLTGDEVHQGVNGTSRAMDGFGTAGCRSERMADEVDRHPSIFSADFAAHFDISSAAMVVARGYSQIKERENTLQWARTLEGSATSTDKMYQFLCSGLAEGVKPQQEHALRLRADMLCRLLGVHWRKQPTADEVLRHPAFAEPGPNVSNTLNESEPDPATSAEGEEGVPRLSPPS